MQMHQICYFLALCEERSFTRAAKRCGISQPSLTNAIIALERELGGALFATGGSTTTVFKNSLFSIRQIRRPKWRVLLAFRQHHFEGFFRTVLDGTDGRFRSKADIATGSRACR